MKKCITCGTTETPYWHSGPRCKRCYSQDPKTKAATARYQLTPSSRFKGAKRRAVSRNKEWTLTFEEYCSFLDKPCYYCKNQLGTPKCYGAGLDRLDNTQGYSSNNVVPCCKYCNSIRNDFITVEETKLLITTLIEFRKS